MNNKEYYNISRDTFIDIMGNIPEDTKEMVKIMFKDQFGVIEFQGDIITTTKRDRLAHCLD